MRNKKWLIGFIVSAIAIIVGITVIRTTLAWFTDTKTATGTITLKNGIVIKFNESSYSWCENNQPQRRYLLKSNYCNKAIEIYVWENDTTYKTVLEFKNYLKNKKDEGTCPLCGKPLKIRKDRNNYLNIFLGCSGWPECKFTKRA